MSAYIEGLVSVVMPTYKRSEKLVRAIKSVLLQTYQNIELLVVNDNEANDEYSLLLEQKIMEFRNDSRFQLINQARHINGAAARNTGISQAKGQYIAFLDDDDWWKKEKIEKQVLFLNQKNSNNAEMFSAVSTLVEYYQNGILLRKSIPYAEGNIYTKILSREVNVTTCSVLLLHEAVDMAGVFDESLPRHQEIQFLASFTHAYKLCICPEYLTCIDITDGENNPTYERLLDIKRLFFFSVQPLITSLPLALQKEIAGSHELELAFVAFRERKIKRFCMHMKKILFCRNSYKLVARRIMQRLQKRG